jgi:hypothetical protein
MRRPWIGSTYACAANGEDECPCAGEWSSRAAWLLQAVHRQGERSAVGGGSQRETNAVVASYWLLFVSALIGVLALLAWEGHHSPERLALYQKHLRAARWRDAITWQHVPYREGAREV